MTNHNPNITSSGATASFTEDANTTGSIVDHVLTGTMNFTDSDHSDTHTTTTALKTAVWSGGSMLPAGTLAKFQAGLTSSIVSDNNGAGKLKWTFSEDDRDFDFLAKNETLVLTYEITLKDNHGGSTRQTVKLTITGTDDRPVFATTTGATLSEQANRSLSLSPDTAHIALQFTDVDLNNTGHKASVLGVSAIGNTSGILPGSFGTAELMSFFDIDNVVKTAGSGNGTVNTTFSAPDLAFDYLAAGEQIKITYVVQIDDQKGGISTQNVTVTVNGTNDRPVVLGFPESEHLTAGQNLSGGNLVAHGDFLFSDIDLSDTHAVSTTVTATRSGGGPVPISEADLIAAMGAALEYDSTSHLLGKVDWSFALPDSALGFLPEGETLTLKYHITITDPSGASDSELVTITVLGTNHAVVTINATVPGGSADTAGEVIDYAIDVANVGSTALTGVTVTDPTVSDLAPVLSGGFNSGDANHDNQLSAGETWHYTAIHTVTQSDLDSNGGGGGVISNTVTADSNETAPVSATASVNVDFNPAVSISKSADVASVDEAGDVIRYTILVQNTGNITQDSAQVDDSQITIVTELLNIDAPVLGAPLVGPVISGDYNIGDTNQNGFQDPGETFQFAIVGDENHNGIQDPGETFVFANAGDTNQNGSQDPGETFRYYNAGDTDQNGTQDPGETFQFLVSHAATPTDADHDGFNDGDVNHDNQINSGETWQYSVTYTVTQDDIDNGGVVQPGLTHDNTATVTPPLGASDADSVSVAIAQNPHVTLSKSATVAGGTADVAGEVIQYAVTVSNDGNMTLTGVAVSDPSVSDLAAVLSGGFNSGDLDSDGKLDIGETWQYTASHTVTQAEIDDNGGGDGTIDNTASVTTDQGASDSASASVTVVQPAAPALAFDISDAIGTRFVDSNENGHADAGIDLIQFTFQLSNTGGAVLHDVSIDDPFLGGTVFGPDILDPGETATFVINHFLTAGEVAAHHVLNQATASGLDPGNNVVSVMASFDVLLPA